MSETQVQQLIRMQGGTPTPTRAKALSVLSP